MNPQRVRARQPGGQTRHTHPIAADQHFFGAVGLGGSPARNRVPRRPRHWRVAQCRGRCCARRVLAPERPIGPPSQPPLGPLGTRKVRAHIPGERDVHASRKTAAATRSPPRASSANGDDTRAGGSSSSGAGLSGAAPAISSGSLPAAIVDVRGSKLGQTLVDGQGHTLYLFEADKAGKSNCIGACTSTWPSHVSNGIAHDGTGVTGALLGTSIRGDDATQVTYRGHRLYHYAGENRPGVAARQGVEPAATWCSRIRPTNSPARLIMTTRAAGIAIARLIRHPRAPREAEAEAAGAVVDAWHRCGVGSWLLGAPAERAKQVGATRLPAWVLPDNVAALGLIRAVFTHAYGPPKRRRRPPGLRSHRRSRLGDHDGRRPRGPDWLTPSRTEVRHVRFSSADTFARSVSGERRVGHRRRRPPVG
jgi:predicted lipoprotein with Yx(FWY)xxD motif